MFMFYVHLNLDYHNFKLTKKIASLHYAMYTLTTGISAHVILRLPMPPAKSWDIGVRSCCTRYVYLSIQLWMFHLKSWCPQCPYGPTYHNRIHSIWPSVLQTIAMNRSTHWGELVGVNFHKFYNCFSIFWKCPANIVERLARWYAKWVELPSPLLLDCGILVWSVRTLVESKQWRKCLCMSSPSLVLSII